MSFFSRSRQKKQEPAKAPERSSSQIDMPEDQFILIDGRRVSNQVGKKRGVEAWQVPDLAAEMRLAGLSYIQTRRFDLPIGNWGGRIGSMMRADGFAVAEALKPLVVSQLGIDPATYDRMCASLPGDYERTRTSIPFFVTFGQRV